MKRVFSFIFIALLASHAMGQRRLGSGPDSTWAAATITTLDSDSIDTRIITADDVVADSLDVRIITAVESVTIIDSSILDLKS